MRWLHLSDAISGKNCNQRGVRTYPSLILIQQIFSRHNQADGLIQCEWGHLLIGGGNYFSFPVSAETALAEKLFKRLSQVAGTPSLPPSGCCPRLDKPFQQGPRQFLCWWLIFSSYKVRITVRKIGGEIFNETIVFRSWIQHKDLRSILRTVYNFFIAGATTWVASTPS